MPLTPPGLTKLLDDLKGEIKTDLDDKFERIRSEMKTGVEDIRKADRLYIKYVAWVTTLIIFSAAAFSIYQAVRVDGIRDGVDKAVDESRANVKKFLGDAQGQIDKSLGIVKAAEVHAESYGKDGTLVFRVYLGPVGNKDFLG